MKSTSVHPIHDDIAVVGWSCRLPGAHSVDDLWALLMEGRCAITSVPGDRFPMERFGHPRRQEPGRSYTWAAGVLDDVWGFDPAVFGISPREAVQIDPQQRILLELTWEALEDAGIPPSSIANEEVGVFVGASQADYGHHFFADPAIADGHFATGTALAVLANRISYIFGLRGPSFTVDTACSSSLVALHQAVQALRSGRVDTAIVAGCNLIASPTSFIAFSQANMLSPTGLCRAFAAEADGFVRAEGAVVLILRKAALAEAARNPVRGIVLASDVNQDGRTNGIALPSLDAQEALLGRIYQRGGIEVDRLAFVEAHGTGTPVGDPIEATAIGRIIGQKRAAALPIGSVKTNIGHLEPASGLAGVLKALLALNHGLLPPSLHFGSPNPHIPFDRLNLSVCTQPLALPNAGRQYAGVNSFGFGGTNAHVVVGAGRVERSTPADDARLKVFAFSANSGAALQAQAREYRNRVGALTDQETAETASAILHRRERQTHRVVIASTRSTDVVEALDAFLAGGEDRRLTVGTAVGRDLPVAFVFSGNGGQYVGMGQAAYRNSAAFRARFEELDGYFKQIGGWSLRDALFSENLAERLPSTRVAQPLVFAIQSASTAALRDAGIEPAVVLGHSVGEVAAAEASGALDLRAALRVIHARSHHQEACRGAGRMAAVLANLEGVRELIEEVGGVEVAAINGPRAITVAGSTEAIEAFRRLAKKRGVAQLDLGLDYPFHTELMAPIRQPLEAELRDLRPRDGAVPFVSSATGACLAGSRLTGAYWWRNVREPVRFTAAVRAAADLGARYFVEIGPRATLVQHIGSTLKGEIPDVVTYAPLGAPEEAGDPFAVALTHAMAAGASVATDRVVGPDPGPAVSLPRYPWQRAPYRFSPTVEALESGRAGRPHPFAGARVRDDALDWRAHVDTVRHPELADHRLGDQVIFPGTGFLEMALFVGRVWLNAERVTLSRIEILNPLDLSREESREILTRVSPGSGTIEILSRPRLSEVGWVLHSKCKLQSGNAAEAVVPDAESGVLEELTGEDLYAIADASGLHYGPAFRLVKRVAVLRGDVIEVHLGAAEGGSTFALDPMRLDACAHGLFAVFPELEAAERGVAYIPVRVDEMTLLRPHVAPRRARIHVRAKTRRSIVADTYVLSSDDELVAILRGVRSQAVPTRRVESLSSVAFVEVPHLIDGAVLGATGVGAGVGDVLAAAEAAGAVSAGPAAGSPAELLLDGWAFATAHETATALGAGGPIDLDAMVEAGRVPPHLRAWVLRMLQALAAGGLARQEDGRWVVAHDPSLPAGEVVLGALAREEQARAGELLAAAAVGDLARRIATGSGEGAEATVSDAVLDFHHAVDASEREASDALQAILSGCEDLWPEDRALRVLQVGLAPLALSLLASGRNVRLTVLEPDRRRHGAAAHAFGRDRGVVLVDAEGAADLGDFDLILGVGGLHRLPPELGLGGLERRLAPGGLLVAMEPRASLFRDLLLGADPAWFSGDGGVSVRSRLLTTGQWQSALDDAGFASVSVVGARYGSEGGALIIAAAHPASDADLPPAEAGPVPERAALVVAPAGDDAFSRGLAAALEGAGSRSMLAVGADGWPEDVDPDVVLHVPPAHDDGVDPVAALTARCLGIKACVERIGDRPAEVWLLFSGALAAGSSPLRPTEAGAWAFARTVANEHPNLDVRKIDVSSALSTDVAIERVRRVVGSGTKETELHLGAAGAMAVRVTGLESARMERGGVETRSAARLERKSSVGGRLSWHPVERRRPGPSEVEVAVEATGLNFRDVMWNLSLLPEDMLEHGLSGPTLGLECAGRVVAVGDRVADLAAGDRVMAMAASAFSTHVTVDRSQVVPIPPSLSSEAAATVPVAFFTAYYGLVTQARLRRGEWVLIHGGAGAVGMAAIQIANALGARVVATAGSRAKRDLVRALGAAHVLDSRSTAFVDDVRRITGEGVDVVLNSLAGEAMERSISCLRPFGRFVELGKRDYVTDTHIGLRPFRRNLTYFGVDVDEVFAVRKAVGRKVFAKVIERLEDGTYVPLPFSVFEGANVASAFHLMQQAHHVGKIVVRPPREGVPRVLRRRFEVRAEGTHLITGAFGGFGLETARWLVDKGARHLVLIGRRGAATEEARAALQEFAARGVRVLADPCDVTDRRALARLFEQVHATMPPLAGVIHAAMVLDDGLLTTLDAERFERVLAPKVAGAEHLDQLVRGDRLDYFVLYSSVTSLVGNPGQANYVAANAYMEALARRRRQAGLPALAIGWGPITDVGVIAEDERLQAGLERLHGIVGMRAREALDLMAEALARADVSVAKAAISISATDGSAGLGRLAVLGSPTYEEYVGGRRAREGEGSVVDLHAIAAKDGVEAARRKATEVIASEVAHVLQMREEDVSRVRPLGEIGLDSLMAMELVLNLEQRFGIRAPLSGASGGMTISDIADQVVASAGLDRERGGGLVAALAGRHHEAAATEDVQALEELIAGEDPTSRAAGA